MCEEARVAFATDVSVKLVWAAAAAGMAFIRPASASMRKAMIALIGCIGAIGAAGHGSRGAGGAAGASTGFFFDDTHNKTA